MATITGRNSYFAGHRMDYFADVLDGTSGDDTISGLGGNDTIFGGAGNDTMYGGTGDDYITANSQAAPGVVANWGLDKAYGGDGNDTLDFARTTARVILYGDGGDDMIFGGRGNDALYGGANNDYIDGGAGADYLEGGTGEDYIGGGTGVDWLFGGADNDTLLGGAGDDRLIGGQGADYMTGNSGFDTFVFQGANESGLTWATADTILDFDRNYDWLDFTIAGTADNFIDSIPYEAGNTWSGGFATVEAWAETQIGNGVIYAFATAYDSSGQKNGYLFADTNGDGIIDTGIELRGATSLQWSDII